MRIADYINNLNLPENISINITGHSLGGSLASVVGLATGLPTYTYNSAGVNPAMIEKYGLNDSQYSNIRAYRTDDDPVTSVQEGPLKPKVVGKVILIASIVDEEYGDKLFRETVKGNTASPALGNKETIETGQGHSIVPMIKHFENDYDKNQSWWYPLLQKNLYQAGHSTEQQTDDHILIILPE